MAGQEANCQKLKLYIDPYWHCHNIHSQLIMSLRYLVSIVYCKHIMEVYSYTNFDALHFCVSTTVLLLAFKTKFIAHLVA